MSSANAVLGDDKLDYLVANFGKIVKDFSPPQDSLEVLSWMAASLTTGIRLIALSPSASDLNWIVPELPKRHTNLLFDGSNGNTQTIHYEIERLSKIGSKEYRKPYLSEWGYLWAQYHLYVITVIAIFIFAFLMIVFVPLIALFMRREPVHPTLPPQNVILRNSPDFVNEARITQWHPEQTLTRLVYGSGKYILETKIDSFGDIRGWIAAHKNSIQVIYPDERALNND